MTLFLDTNIILDFFLERKPFYYSAAALLTLTEEKGTQVFVSTHSIVTSEYICCERMKMPVSQWKRKITALLSIIEIQPIAKEDLLYALQHDWNDFEDCVMYHCAKRYNCNKLITRNPKDFLIAGGIEIQLPESFLQEYS